MTSREHHVVIADSDPENRTRMARIVAEVAGDLGSSLALHEAEDGTTAYNLVVEHASNVLLAEILLDGVSGLELLRQLKEDRGSAAPAVVFVTDMATEVDRYWALRSGAAAYVMKPYDDDVLRERVKQVLGDTALDGSSDPQKAVETRWPKES